MTTSAPAPAPTPPVAPAAAAEPVTHLLYLHGFRSSPQSFKARYLSGPMHRLYDRIKTGGMIVTCVGPSMRNGGNAC